MDTSSHFQSHLSLAQGSAALGESHELLDFYPGDERNHQRTTGAGHTTKSPARVTGAAAVRTQ